MLKAYLNPAQFSSSTISSKSSSVLETKRFVQFPLLEIFVKNSNRIQVLHQSFLAIFLSRQKVNLLQN